MRPPSSNFHYHERRVTLVGYSSTSFGLDVKIPENDKSYVKGVTGEYVRILQSPGEYHETGCLTVGPDD